MTTQEKMNAIALTFGAKTGARFSRRCTGKWSGTTDWSILFDNGERLFIGNSGGSKKFSQYVDECYELYNSIAVQTAKDYALKQLRQRAPQDNEFAERLGHLPYEVESVELITSDKGGHIGWFYVVLRIGDKIVNHLETGLNYNVGGQMFSETVRPKYYVAGGLKDDEVDYIFNGVGFSSASSLYKPKKELVFHKMFLFSEVA
jgi:hypothetical protein